MIQEYNRDFADNFMRQHGEELWKAYNTGVTVGGRVLMDWYTEKYGYSLENYEKSQCLLHYVASAGLDKNGKFKYQLSRFKQDC